MSSPTIPFVHLGARSEASLGESIARVEELCWEASRDEQGYIALTDVNSLARLPALALAAPRSGLRPVFGAELGVLPLGENQFRGVCFRVRLLVENERGWRNLVRLVTRARRAETATRPPHVSLATLVENARGLLVFLGGEHGEVTQLAAEGNYERLEELVKYLAEAFGRDHLFLELPPVPVAGQNLMPVFHHLAGYFDLMTVLVPRVRCAHSADDAVFRIFAGELPPCEDPIRRLRHLNAVAPGERGHLLTRAQVSERFPECDAAIATTLAVAQHCAQFTLPQVEKRFQRGNFGRGLDAESYIWNNCFTRASERYGDLPTRYKERLNFEFREIVDAGLANAVVGLVRLNEELEAEGVQRGPGAGLFTNSVIASLLGLTRLDPLKFDLSFELTAGLGKGSFPLLELSIPANQEAAAATALGKLFEGQIARVGEWKTWKTQQCLERLGQLLGKDAKWAGKMARNSAFANERQLAAGQPATWLPDGELPLDATEVLAWLVARMAGRARELAATEGVYTFAVDPIDSVVPMRRPAGSPLESQELPVSEWSEEELGRLRHGRIAFVHSPLLDLIGESTGLVREQGNESYSPEQTAPDDATTYRLLREGRTLGIAPLESPAIRKRLRQGQPTDLHALIKILKAEGNDCTREDLPDFSTILLCHVCAAIKAHNPAAFYAAALSQSASDTRRVSLLLDEARGSGIEISELLVNYSAARWTVETNTLRPGFIVVRGLSAGATAELLKKRREMQYADLADVCKRTDRNRLKSSHLRALIKAGAFDNLANSRRELLSQLEELFPLLRAGADSAATDGGTFFGHDAGWWIRENEIAPAQQHTGDTPEELLAHEMETCGLRLHDAFNPAEEDFLQMARVERSAARFTPKMEGRVLSFLARPGMIVPDRENAGYALLDAGGMLVHCHGTIGEKLDSNDYTARRVLLTGTLHREPFQWHLNVVAMNALDEAMAEATAARALSLDVSTLSQPQLKALNSLLKTFPGETRLAMAWLPTDAPRLVRSIASRQVLLCPLLRLGLDRILGAGEWQVIDAETVAERTSAERVRMMGRRVSSIAVRKLQALFSR